MRRLFRSDSRTAVLVMGCGVAVVLHALLFSCLHLRATRRSPPEVLRSSDNTPELLQFSSLPAGRAHSDGLPIPQSNPLPPPPNLFSSMRQPTQAVDGAAAASRLLRKGRSSQRTTSLTQRRAEFNRDRQGRSLAIPGRDADPSLRALDHQRDLALAMEQLRTFLRQDTSLSESARSADSKDQGATERPQLLRIAVGSHLQDAFQTLWKLGQPQSLQSLTPGFAKKTDLVDVRLISLRQVRANEVPILHGQFVVLPDKVLLVWMQGEKLYFLQTSRDPLPSP